ncbi:MAG: DUF2804 domain-containing protein, partial [Spirochaetales bacterium]|nr:DUF2804 domain-containing protein [Spirochaetales bacterium]
KEWDYYYVFCPENEIFLTFTISDLGFAGLFAIAMIDLKNKTFAQIDDIKLLTLGKVNLAPSADEEHDVIFSGKKISLEFRRQGDKRVLIFSAPDFEINGQRGLSGNIILSQKSDKERMVIATSWKENRKAFYYNQKINCMPATGLYRLGGKEINFSHNALAGLDWGRGVWTRKNRWFWGSASAMVNNQPFGFNIGYGFTDRTPASENMIFYKDITHKIEDIEFVFDKNDYMKPWKFITSDHRLDMDFIPAVDRSSKFDLKLIQSFQHQVFGYFRGTAILDDGEKIEFKDLPGFAEDVYNKW